MKIHNNNNNQPEEEDDILKQKHRATCLLFIWADCLRSAQPQRNGAPTPRRWHA